MRRRIILAEIDKSAAVKIACRGYPGPALPSLARVLVERDEPVALYAFGQGHQVGVGRAGPLDDPDPGQNRLPAALSVSDPSGLINR